MAVFLFIWSIALASVAGQESILARTEALLREGRAGDALPLLLELHRSQPSNADLCQKIGLAYTQVQDLAHAETFYRQAVHLNPQFWAARKNLGTVLWFLDRKGESEREFQTVTRALPEDPVPHLYLGLAAHARGEFPRAKAQFEKAGTLASQNPEVLPVVLETYLAMHDLIFPERMAKQLASAANTDAVLTQRAGALFLQYGHADLASTVLVTLTARDANEEVWRMLGEAYDRQKKPEEAYRAYTRAIVVDPDSEDAYIALAEFASAHANNDYALQVVSRGLTRLPRSAGLAFERGILAAMNGDRNQAEANFVAASRLKPDWDLPLLAIGVSRLESGNAAQAVISFQEARAIAPADFRAHYLYATALSREGGQNSRENRSKATDAVRRAIELNPRDARSHALLGQLELAAGKPDAAALEWHTALKIEPENTSALYQLGLLYQKQGKAAEAETLLQAFRRAKTKMRGDEESLVEILRVVPNKHP